MWIELDETGVAAVLAAVNEPSIVEKLTPKPPHPYEKLFIDATSCYSHDNPIDNARGFGCTIATRAYRIPSTILMFLSRAANC